MSWALGIATQAAAALRSEVAAASCVRVVARSSSVELISACRRAAAEASLVSRRVRFSMRASMCRSAARGGAAARRAASSSSTSAVVACRPGLFGAREEFLPGEKEALSADGAARAAAGEGAG